MDDGVNWSIIVQDLRPGNPSGIAGMFGNPQLYPVDWNNFGFCFDGNGRLGLAGVMSNYNSIVTKGLGVSAIYGAGAQTLNTNVAPTTLTYTPPATAGVYRLSGYLNALTAGTMTFKVKITYKDAGGNAVTDIPAFYRQNTTALIAGGMTANAADRYIMFPHTFSIDNSATAITIQDNAGTYTAGTYYWTPILEQLA